MKIVHIPIKHSDDVTFIVVFECSVIRFLGRSEQPFINVDRIVEANGRKYFECSIPDEAEVIPVDEKMLSTFSPKEFADLARIKLAATFELYRLMGR